MSNSVNVDFEPDKKTALERYIDLKTTQYLEINGPEFGQIDIENLKFDIAKTVSRTKRFFDDEGMDCDSQLVIGKVQSGKTAHLLGVIAALVDSKCSLCVVISGITGALNRQTKIRLEKDLGGIESHPVSIHPLPTMKDLHKTNVLPDVKEKVKLRIDAQRSGNYLRIPSLPVIPLLESKQRIEALEVMVNEFREEFGKDFIVVIIDDEADQASQNTLTSIGDESKIFKVIKRIRKSKARNYLLSYTATPHAILLTEKEGALRPRICTVSNSGTQYFGLQHIMESNCPTTRMQVLDVPTINQIEPPGSLRSAVLKFLIKGLILREAPEIFFGCDDELVQIPIRENTKSSQMLVHPSSRVVIHDDYYTWINEKIINDLKKLLGNGSFQPDPEFVTGELATAYLELRSEIGEIGKKLPPDLPNRWIFNLGVSVASSTKILVINSSLDRKTPEDMPSENSDWMKFQNWILIGGDIVGRGVTIPTLTTTYFLRNPQNAQFDTLSQQMRFCGYRRQYSSFVSIYAPPDVLDQFEDLLDIDSVLHAMTRKWDNEATDLFNEPPGLCFAKRAGSKIIPTRRGVVDPTVKIEQVGRIAFQGSSYANPVLGRHNSKVFCEFLAKNLKPDFTSEDWQSFEDVPHDSVKKLFQDFLFSNKDVRKSKIVSLLLDEVLGKFSLLDTPVSIATRNLNLLRVMSQGGDLGEFLNIGLNFRGCSEHGLNVPADSLKKKWDENYIKNSNGLVKLEWFDTAEFRPLVGDSERSQQDRMSIGGSVLLVAPYALVVRQKKLPISAPIGFGIGIMFLGPNGRNIEIEGF